MIINVFMQLMGWWSQSFLTHHTDLQWNFGISLIRWLSDLILLTVLKMFDIHGSVLTCAVESLGMYKIEDSWIEKQTVVMFLKHIEVTKINDVERLFMFPYKEVQIQHNLWLCMKWINGIGHLFCRFPPGFPWVRYHGVYNGLNISLVVPGKCAIFGEWRVWRFD